MAYDPERHHRRSIRLRGYDYRRAGAYFVTICTHRRRLLFGEVARGRMRLSPCGRVAAEEWERTAEVRDNVESDAFVVMPNHVHGIIVITDDGVSGNRDACNNRRGTPAVCPYYPGVNDSNKLHGRAFGNAVAGSLSSVMRQYKSIVTRRCRRTGRPGFAWQRNYYERVLRDRRELRLTRRYIIQNPQQWHDDRLSDNRLSDDRS